MSVSQLLSQPARCPACGHGWVPDGWSVVDVEERPELRAPLADDTWRTWRCPACDAAIERGAPLLVLLLSPEAPVVLGVPDGELLADDPIEPHRDLLDRTVEALGIRRHDFPGPVVAAPFDVLVFAATRDVTADVAADHELPDAPTETARRYAIFLQMLRDSRPKRRINIALARLLALRSGDDVRAAFAEVPELRERPVRERLEQELVLAGDAEERHIAQARFDLVLTASTGRFDEAWSGYERALLELSQHHLGPRVMALLDELRAEEGGDPGRAIELGEELLAQLHGLGRSGVRVETLLRTAAAYYNAQGPDVEDRLDRGIALCQEALDVMAAGIDDFDDAEVIEDWHIQALVNLSAAYGPRHRGDPVANHERASEAARRVLDRVSFESNPKVWAMIKTNLGISLVHRAKERPEDDPEREGELAEALTLFGDALRWRSFERDPLDWAYTQMGLGLAYGHRRGADRRGDLRAAIDHHRACARGMHAAGAEALEAQAWHNVASEAVMLAGLDDTPADERAELIAQAEEACARSLSLRPDDVDPVGAGATRGVLAGALELRGDPAAAMASRREALEGLRPDTAPHAARREALELARLALRNGDHETAADAYDIAAQAAAAALEGRADTAGRFEELERGLNVFRWAAGALLQAGRARRAVEVLEQGRSRELATWLRRDSESNALRHADPTLHERFTALAAQLDHHEADRRAGQPVDLVAAAETQEAYAKTVEAIRAVPGCERFLRPPAYEDIAASVGDREALVYVFSAPAGTAAILVAPEGGPEVVRAADLTSGRVVQALIRPDVDTGTIAGYLVAQATASEELDEEIAALGGLLAPHVLRPLAAALERRGVDTVCLVAAGLLGQVPLYALTWDDGDCLVARFDVILAPSALARDICRRRAADRRGPGRLMVVGNPLPHPIPLPAAEQEAELVAGLVPATETVLLTREDATAEAVARELPSALHAHLACHGSAVMSPEALDGGLYFSGNVALTAADLLELAPLQARLVLASACETGIIPGYETVDEALSLGTVLLGAGAAGAITSLWAVNDFATGLLMSRFYEELVADATPARALRAAMLWLRDLPLADALAYARARPPLRRHARDAGDACAVRPFAAPTMWAAFALNGG
jgi:CHAT domain-containing protein